MACELKGTEFVNKKAIVLSDSLCQNIRYLNKAVVKSYSGCNIKKLNCMIKSNRVNIAGYEVIVISIGTNDLVDKKIWLNYLKKINKAKNGEKVEVERHFPTSKDIVIDKYKSLLESIRDINSTATLLISAILPRPYDHQVNKHYMKEINAGIKKLAELDSKAKFLTTYKPFIYKGDPRLELFSTDGLHLSKKGTNLLTDIFASEIAIIVKQQ